jgi:hypothetical protein
MLVFKHSAILSFDSAIDKLFVELVRITTSKIPLTYPEKHQSKKAIISGKIPLPCHVVTYAFPGKHFLHKIPAVAVFIMKYGARDTSKAVC